jgi:hypothetical protein
MWGRRSRRNAEEYQGGYYVPPAPRRPRRRRFHIAAILAAALYFGAAYVAYELYRSAWVAEERIASGPGDATGADGGGGQAPAATPQDRAALLALAERAQESVVIVESSGSGQGSGFVAWVMQGDSYVMTARRAVRSTLDGGGRTVFVRRGSQIWTGRVIRAHQANGLALIQVNADLGRPLWQQRGDADELEPESPALVVPAGPETAIGEGMAGPQQEGRIPVHAQGEPLNLGAPVLGGNGRIAGVVTQTEPGGINQVVPIEAACAAEIRRCS